MDYEVVVTDDAFEDLDHILYYLLFVLKNEQAAQSVLDDFYFLLYRIEENSVIVDAVFHDLQDFEIKYYNTEI